MAIPDTIELSPINPNPKSRKPGTFGRDNPPPGKGRVRGSVNRLSRDLRSAILDAAALYGSDGHGAGGVTGYCIYLAAKHPKAFSGLLSKLLPLQINGAVTSSVAAAVRVVAVASDSYLSREDLAKLREPMTIEADPVEVEPATESGNAA